MSLSIYFSTLFKEALNLDLSLVNIAWMNIYGYMLFSIYWTCFVLAVQWQGDIFRTLYVVQYLNNRILILCPFSSRKSWVPQLWGGHLKCQVFLFWLDILPAPSRGTFQQTEVKILFLDFYFLFFGGRAEKMINLKVFLALASRVQSEQTFNLPFFTHTLTSNQLLQLPLSFT